MLALDVTCVVLVAVMLYTPAEAGAVKVTGTPDALELELKLPPVADQETPTGSSVVATTERVWVTTSPAPLGEIVTLMLPVFGDVTVIVALAVLFLLLTDLAVSVTVAGEGTLVGAV